MADSNHAPVVGYSPDMDAVNHEATYDGFVRFVEIGISFVVCIVLGLALGAIDGVWTGAVIGIVLAHITTAMGLFSRAIAWRANAVVAALLVIMIVLF